MSSLATFYDIFNGTAIDLTRWALSGSSSNFAVANNVLSITSDTTAGDYYTMTSVNSFDMTGAGAYIKVVSSNTKGANIASLERGIQLVKDSNNSVLWTIVGTNSLQAKKHVAGTYSTVASMTFDASNTPWLRIREKGGSIFWDYSPDGINWTNLTSISNPFAVTAMFASINVGIDSSETQTTTVQYSNFNIMTSNVNMFIQKHHDYIISDSSGVYKGLLPNVTSDFGYNQNVQTVGAQIEVTVAQSADVAQLPVEPIYSEDGNPLTDENGNTLLIERQPDVVGSSNANALIQNNNQIKVYEYSSYYPNGLLVFSGYISKWKAKFGNEDNIVITCLNNGQDLNNYPVATGDTASISQTTDNGTTKSVYPNNNHNLTSIAQGQNFTAASTISVGGVTVELTTVESGTLSIGVYSGNLSAGSILGGSALASGTVHVGTLSTKTVQKVTFNVPSTLTSGQQYYFLVQWSPDNTGSANPATVYLNSTNPYSSGDSFTVNSSGTYYSVGSMNNADMYFVIWAHGTSTTSAYSAKDPTFILTDVINNYNAAGGQVSIPSVAINSLVSCQLNDATLPSGYWGDAFAQIFTPSKNLTINIVQLYMGISSGSETIYTVSIVKGDPSLDSASVISGSYGYTLGGSNTVIANSNSTTVTNSTPAPTAFSFTNPVNLISGQEYYLLITWGQGQYGNLITKGASTGEAPADTQVGRLYISNATINNASAYPALNSSYPYMFFNLAYLNPLPTKLTGGYSNTGNSLTYTFKLQTILQAIQTLFNAAPANWYWYVDPATNVLQWAATNTVADLTIIKGKHINTLEIEATKENIKNIVYFAGGDDGTGTNTNILVKKTATISPNRVGLAILSDNRVNSTNGGTTAAALFANEYLADNASETYITNVTLLDRMIDTNLIKLGMMIGFAGFGNFADSLLLQVVGIQRKPDEAILQLGTLPIRASQAVSQLQAEISAQQTVNTTTTPS